MSSSTTIGRLQSFVADAKWKPNAEKSEASRKVFADSAWADGLRGIAAVYVMFSHMTLAFARYVVAPAISHDGPSYLLQKPIIRLVGQGPAWVSTFIILSGFVNALRPIKLARAGQIDSALANLATSAFRRSFRLVIPAFVATAASWFICQLGAYETARNSDAFWIALTSPRKSPSWSVAIDDLITAVRDTWTFDPNNPYDQPQWALLYLLMGSMICFSSLLMFVNLTSFWRVICVSTAWCWAWNWDIKLGSPYAAVGIFTGILFAELHHSSIPLRLSGFSPFFTPPLTIISLILMSFPAEYQSEKAWCRYLLRLHYKIFPEFAFVDRTWPTMGAALLCFTIIMSPHLRKFLSGPIFAWLGKISFPLYLLHGSFMRSILSWLLFAKSRLVQFRETNGGREYIVMKYPLPGGGTFFVVFLIFFPILFTAAHLWAITLEPQFAIITKAIEELLFGKEVAKREVPVKNGSILPIRKD